MHWTDDAPTAPGVYWWRRSWQWEPVKREIEVDQRVKDGRYVKRIGEADRLVTFSHHYEQYVTPASVGGQWGDPVKEEG